MTPGRACVYRADVTFRSLLTGRRLLPIVVALVGLALVVDVCVLPAAAKWTHVDGIESHAPGNSHQPDGSHLTSCCDAKSVKGAPSCPHASDLLVAVLTDAEIVNGEVPRGDQTLSTFFAPRRAPARSLFLLNAVFLI